MNLHAAGPHWISFGILDSGGAAYAGGATSSARRATGEGGDVLYERMMAEAACVPAGSEGLLFLPYLLGERSLGSADSRGIFFGSPSPDRACTCNARDPGGHLLRPATKPGDRARVRPGDRRDADRRGGASSALWSQIKADVYGIPISTLQHEEAGILGAAMLAGLGVKAYASEADAANRLVRTRERFIPDPQAAARYNQQYRALP